MRHHVDRVDRLFAFRLFIHLNRRNLVHHRVRNLVSTLGPGINNLVVLLALRDEAVDVLLLIFLREQACLFNKTFLLRRNNHVVHTEGNTCTACLTETKTHDLVTEDNRLLLTTMAINHVDHAGDFTLGEQTIDKIKRHLVMTRQHLRNHHTPWRGVNDQRNRVPLFVFRVPARFDLGVQRDGTLVQRMLDLGEISKHHTLARFIILHLRDVVETQNNVL